MASDQGDAEIVQLGEGRLRAVGLIVDAVDIDIDADGAGEGVGGDGRCWPARSEPSVDSEMPSRTDAGLAGPDVERVRARGRDRDRRRVRRLLGAVVE